MVSMKYYLSNGYTILTKENQSYCCAECKKQIQRTGRGTLFTDIILEIQSKSYGFGNSLETRVIMKSAHDFCSLSQVCKSFFISFNQFLIEKQIKQIFVSVWLIIEFVFQARVEYLLAALQNLWALMARKDFVLKKQVKRIGYREVIPVLIDSIYRLISHTSNWSKS